MRWRCLPGLLLFVFAPVVKTAQPDCGSTYVVVESASEEDRSTACSGVERALKSIERCGYSISQPVRIRFTEDGVPLADQHGPLAGLPMAGCYLAKTSTVYVETSRLPLSDRTKAFGRLPMSDELLISIVAHEITHHVYHHLCSARRRATSRAASEYVAYVVQLEALDEVERAQVLECWPNITLPSRLAVNFFLWALDPPRFGVMAYRYHLTDPDLFCDILRGDYVVPHFGAVPW